MSYCCGIPQKLNFASFFLLISGDAKQTIEVFEADIKKFHTVTAQGTFGKFGILLDSHVHSGGGTCNNYVQLGVYLDENLRPTITLLDNVKSWNIGKISILLCKSCAFCRIKMDISDLVLTTPQVQSHLKDGSTK